VGRFFEYIANELHKIDGPHQATAAGLTPNGDAVTSSASSIPSHRSAWHQAVWVAERRSDRRRRGLSDSITAIADEIGCSRGRVSELLSIRGAFDAETVSQIGLGDSLEGEELLSRLSYRDLRSLLRNSGGILRVFAVRRLARETGSGRQSMVRHG
jgi:hypothetical protein